MAWRIHEAVLRGEIDNRVQGRVTGRIWFVGLSQPVVLDLQGDCHRDLAGCRLEFTNPEPKEDANLEGFNLLQDGSIGDMTAARKVKVPSVSLEELRKLYISKQPVPSTLANSLYLEWFSSHNGRVVIESTQFQCTISERTWTLSPEDEQRQFNENQAAMTDFLDAFTGAVIPEDSAEADTPFESSPFADGPKEEDPKPMDEFEAERFLQECDRRTDRYMELLDKYENHPDQDRIIARAMGWDRLDPDLAADEEAEVFENVTEAFGALTSEDDSQDWDSDAELVSDEDPESTGIGDDPLDPIGDHPLCERVHALCVNLHQDAKNLGISFHEDETTALHKLYRGIIYASGKLAGALNGNEDDCCLEPGITVAWLKRALNFLHEAIDGAAAALDQDTAPKPWIESVRTELFDIRTEILRLMDTYRRLI